MHILTTSTTPQTIKAILRSSPASADVLIYDKSERETSTVSADSITTTDGISTITLTLSGANQLKEGRFYSITVKDGSDVEYSGMVFCTDQTDYNKYETGKDDYVVEDSYDNEFIII
jgi:hypothetical protein